MATSVDDPLRVMISASVADRSRVADDDGARHGEEDLVPIHVELFGVHLVYCADNGTDEVEEETYQHDDGKTSAHPSRTTSCEADTAALSHTSCC